MNANSRTPLIKSLRPEQLERDYRLAAEAVVDAAFVCNGEEDQSASDRESLVTAVYEDPKLTAYLFRRGVIRLQ